MNVGSLGDYIKYRLQRADEALEEAKILAENKKWNAVVNRLYYSCFYSVNALLINKNIKTKTHDGTRTQLNLNFIKTGEIEEKYGKLYSRLFDFRQKGDYGDFYDFDEAIAKPLINKVEDFNKIVKSKII